MTRKPMIEFKPRVGPVTVDVNEFWRGIRGQQNSAIEGVGQRFVQLFNDHGIVTSQIPRWIPKLTLAELNDTERLLSVLSPEILQRAADIFGVQRTWIEGASRYIYQSYTCYKQPEALFRLLAELKCRRHSYPVRALTSTKALDYRDGTSQPLALVVVEKIADSEGVENIRDIDRYHVFGDMWDWGDRVCRIHLKGIVRAIDQNLGERLPLHTISEKELEAVQEGRLIPRKFFDRSPLTDPSLEDYTCSRSESAQAKEIDELPDVLHYVESNGLAEIAQILASKSES